MMLRMLIVFTCHLLVLQPVLAEPLQGGLKIVIVEGAGTRNVAQQITARPLVVRVENVNNNPVAGAVVTFTAPEGGPSGEFSNDSRILRVTTGPDGLAQSGPYHPNAAEGSYQIQVGAEFQGQTASIAISQLNIAQKKGHGKLIAILAIGGAAVAATIAARNNGTSSSTNSSTITFGGLP